VETHLNKHSDDVFVVEHAIAALGAAEMLTVREQALRSPRRRARVCAHLSGEDAVHEMMIVLCSDTYIRPHRHFSKSESFHVVEGEVDVIIMDEKGGVKDVIALGPWGSGRSFFYRMAKPEFHTLVIRSAHLLIHEVTTGPFDPNDTEQAAFAPAEGNTALVDAYKCEVEAAVAAWQEHTQNVTGDATSVV